MPEDISFDQEPSRHRFANHRVRRGRRARGGQPSSRREGGLRRRLKEAPSVPKN